MVIRCTSLLFQALYFISDVIFLEFTFVPIFYWTIMYICILFSLFIFYLDITYRIILWILNLLCLRRFLSSWVSRWSANGMYHLWKHKLFLFFSQYHVDWAVLQCSYLSYLHYILPLFPLYLFYYYFALSSVDASQESCLGTVVNVSTP